MKQRVIVIGTYGWVFTGYMVTDLNDSIVLDDASVIRTWGTTKGLGQLALNGPTGDTILDQAGRTTVPKTSVVAVIECQGWA